MLRGQGITIVLIGPRGARLGGDEAATTAVARTGADRAADGTPVSGQAVVGGTTLLVEARPARTGAFALVQTAETAPAVAPQLRRNIGYALLAGVGAALVVGVLAGRLLARQLRRTRRRPARCVRDAGTYGCPSRRPTSRTPSTSSRTPWSAARAGSGGSCCRSRTSCPPR